MCNVTLINPPRPDWTVIPEQHKTIPPAASERLLYVCLSGLSLSSLLSSLLDTHTFETIPQYETVMKEKTKKKKTKKKKRKKRNKKERFLFMVVATIFSRQVFFLLTFFFFFFFFFFFSFYFSNPPKEKEEEEKGIFLFFDY
jgi:hypothetical protein